MGRVFWLIGLGDGEVGHPSFGGCFRLLVASMVLEVAWRLCGYGSLGFWILDK